MIREKIERNWRQPIGVESKGLCDVYVKLDAVGKVINVTVKHCSSNNAAYASSVEAAVYKSSPLPLPSDPRLADNFLKDELHIKFKP